MQRSARLNLFIYLVILIVYQGGSAQGEESRTTRLLQKAVENSFVRGVDSFRGRVAFLYACDRNWIAAETTIEQIKVEDSKNEARLKVAQAAILSGNEEWARKLAPTLDWAKDDVTTIRSLQAASEGDFEKAIQFADQVKSEYISHQLYCELARDFGNRGELKQANELFLRALAQEESGASMALFETAFATRYRPLIQEMFQRNYMEEKQQSENYNFVDYFLSDAASLFARNGFVDEAFESLEKTDSKSECLSTQDELFDILIEEGNEEGIQQLLAYRLKHDPSFSLPDARRIRIIKLKLRQKEWKAAESEIWRLEDNFSKANYFANLSTQLFAAGETKSAKHKCSVAGQLVALAYSENIKNNYRADSELWGKYVETLSRQAVALYSTGEVEESEAVIQKALKIGNDRSSGYGSPFDSASAEILAAFQKMGKTAEAHGFVIQILSWPVYRTVEQFISSDPLAVWLKIMLDEYGLDAVQEYVHIIQDKDQRHLLSEIIGQIQLQVEGPDADLNWIDKLQKRNASATIYLLEAERELSPRIKKIESQIERIRLFPQRAGCLFF